MRIACLCRSLPFHRQGGMEWHAWDLARGLARRGHTVRILTTPFPSASSPPATSPASSSSSHPSHKNAPPKRPPAEPGIEFHEVGREQSGRYSLPYFTEAARTAVEWARRGNIDLIHGQGFAALFLDPARLPSNVPLLATIHGTWWSETLLDRRARSRLPGWRQIALLWKHRHRVLLESFHNRFLRRQTLLIVDSEFTRSELIRDCPELEGRIQAIPLGLDLGRFPPAEKPAANPGAVRLLALGRLERSKGFDVALEGLARCGNRDWILRIGGEGPDRPRLESLASRLFPADSAPEVEFLGRVPDDRLAREFAQADLFLNPDLTQPAFGLVALEAMLQATPVLAARVGAMPEVLGADGGWLVAAGDPEVWSRALDLLLADPARLRRQGVDARRSALERFSLDRMVGAVEAAYRSALSTGN